MWSEKHEAATRSEAIRRLVELGLSVRATKPKQAPQARAERAKDLAAKVIDSFPVTTDVEETANRKRRLLKGPEEFRDLRVDRPKAKTK